METAKRFTGLGISIAKVLTEQIHGIINADYHDGKISICILLPEEYK